MDHQARPWTSEPGIDRFARFEDLRGVKVTGCAPDVRGWKLVTSDGRTVGRIQHFIVNWPARQVDFLEAVLRFPEAAPPRSVLVPMPCVTIDSLSRAVRLATVPSTRIAALPAFKGLPLDESTAERCRTHFAWARRLAATGR